VKEVSEIGDEPMPLRIVVVGAKERQHFAIAFEGAPNADEGILVHLNVGIYKYKDVS